jgi:ribosomal protein L11 methyltransferase
MPYRVDLARGDDATFDRLVELGAFDAELLPDGHLAALLPDGVSTAQLARTLGSDAFAVSPALGRDEDSVWVLRPRPVRVGRLRIVPADTTAAPDDMKLLDSAAFGTGLHPTTALCLEALGDLVETHRPQAVLDVGTGSGVLALAALMMGVPRAVGIDVDAHALAVAAENASLNALAERLCLVRGGPEAVDGAWPVVLANVLAAPLIEMAPVLVRRVGHHGSLVLSGIPCSAEEDVHRAYRHLGMQRVRSTARAGWVAAVLRASW